MRSCSISLKNSHGADGAWRRVLIGVLVVPLLVPLLLGAAGCRSTEPLSRSADAALLAASDEQRAARQALAAVPLEERIALIEADMQRTLVEVGDGALAPRQLSRSGRPGPVHLETNAAVLSALAAKYGATGDPESKALGERIIRGIIALDALSGELDGFIPRFAAANTLEPARSETTHSNAYTQLFFAYVLADRYFGPNEDLQRHVSLIYQRWVDDGFALKQIDGSYVGRANLQALFMHFNARKTFDRRLLDDAAYHLGDEATRALVEQHRWRSPRLGPLHLRLFAAEFPTTSSSWLNLQALTALTLLGNEYGGHVVDLAGKYERDDNPFFRVLAAMCGGDEDLAAIRQRLEEFPYPATTSGIINSHRDDVSLGPKNFIKLRASPESHEPLPLYDVRSSTYLWKRSLLQIDSMPEQNPEILLGHDLYQAYWLLRLLEQDR